MRTRQEMKQGAKTVLKRHYWMLVVLCLLAAAIGSEFGESIDVVTQFSEEDALEAADGEMEVSTIGNAGIISRFTTIIQDIITGDTADGEKIAQENIQANVQASKAHQNQILGRSRGVFSMIINEVSSGAFLVSLTVGIQSIIGSKNVTVMILIILSLLVALAVWVFGIQIYVVVMRRMFLEGRCYKKVHPQRALFLLKVRKWARASLTIFIMSLYQILWSLTIVGGIIKRYSYYMVPYIVAENPAMTAKEAITLSREMMDGHKWECFVFELSFIGWKILGFVTAGLFNVFYSNPYQVAAFSEYYADLRRLGKEKRLPYIELLDDLYLFENPNLEKLHKAYGDVVQELKEPEKNPGNLTGIRKFLANTFGLVLLSGRQEIEYEQDQARRILLAYDKEALEGKVYPTRLSAIPETNKRKWVGSVNYIRCYSVWSIVMQFFLLSFMGWAWEVSLHLISDGAFVNRGVLHGPWLPIYGSGGVLILLLLNRFRKKPVMEFFAAVVLCGCVEYGTSYYLEIAHNGKKWWDYSGYFLNLNGRICAEGLLVFGLGGMMIVYVLAPVADNLLRRIPFKVLILTCVVLLAFFAVDQAYSRKHPNTGKGITDYTGAWLKPEHVPLHGPEHFLQQKNL